MLNSASARYGIGYKFFGRLVAKKVYSAYDRNFLQNTDLMIKSNVPFDIKKDFRLKLSKHGLMNYSSIRIFKKRVSHPLMSTSISEVLRIQAVFKEAWNNYVELEPIKEMIFPEWTKSFDLWVYGIEKKLDVYIYLSNKPGKIMRIKMGRLDYDHWRRLYANLYDPSYRNERQLRLLKIRIIGHKQNAVDELITYIAGFQVYNFKRTPENLYSEPIYPLFSIEENEDINWKLQIGSSSSDRNFLRKIFDSDRNKPVIHILIPKELHNDQDIFIFFNKPAFIYENYLVSIWVNGFENNENVSLIFRDTNRRLFEVEFGRFFFKGWKRVIVKVPNIFFLQKPYYIRKPYISLWGIKISSRRQRDIEFRMDNILCYKDYRFGD